MENLYQPTPNYWLKDTFVEDLEALTTIDKRNKFIGLQNKTPSCLLDANGMIKGTDFFAANNVMAGSNVIAQHNVFACNIESCNVTATEVMGSKVIAVGSNIYINGFSLHEPCPNDNNAWLDLLPFQNDDVGFIHESWIIKPRTAASVLSDLWDIADGIIDWADRLKTLYDLFVPSIDPELPDNPYWDWEWIKDRPIASKGEHIGFNDDIFISDEAKLKVCPESKFMTNELTGILDFNFIVDNLPVDPSGDTIIDFGTRVATFSNLQLSNIKPSFIEGVTHPDPNPPITIGTDGIITTKDYPFSIGNISFIDSNIPQNAVMGVPVDDIVKSYIWTTDSNLQVNGVTLCNDDMQESMIEADKVWTSRVCKQDGKGSSLAFYGYETWLKQQNTAPNNPQDWRMSILALKDNEIRYETYPSYNENQGYVNPTVQWKVDSNGSMFCKSNLQMLSPATIISTQAATMDLNAGDGLLSLAPDTFRYVQRSYVGGFPVDKINFSFNSNGLFLLQNNKVFGKTETFFDAEALETVTSKFSRLEMSLQDGMRYGSGVAQSAMDNDYDVFKVSRKGEISTFNKSTGLLQKVVDKDSTWVAPIKYGAFTLSNDALYMGKLKISASGGVYMKFSTLTDYELIISTIKQFKADTQNQAYTKTAFNL
jgi:hypothetical protein